MDLFLTKLPSIIAQSKYNCTFVHENLYKIVQENYHVSLIASSVFLLLDSLNLDKSSLAVCQMQKKPKVC